MNAFVINRVYADLWYWQGAFRDSRFATITVGFAVQFYGAFRQTLEIFSRVERPNFLSIRDYFVRLTLREGAGGQKNAETQMEDQCDL